MKITTLNNQELVIQARENEFFEAVLKVARKIESLSNNEVVFCSYCQYEKWAYLCCAKGLFNKEELNEFYKEAKKKKRVEY